MNLETALDLTDKVKLANPTATNLILERRYSLLGKTYIDYAVVDKNAYERVMERKQDWVAISIYKEV